MLENLLSKENQQLIFEINSMTKYNTLLSEDIVYSNRDIRSNCGVLYGLGKSSLATRLNCSIEEAENIIQSLYKSFPKLREYVAKQQQYPLQNDGYINTMLGDKLKIAEYEYYQKATSNKEKKGLEARIQRLGVNLPINLVA